MGRGPDRRPTGGASHAAYGGTRWRGAMALAKRHGPTVFLLVMVTIMVFVMSLALGLLNGAYSDGLWPAWPRQFLVAYAVALPAAAMARAVAAKVVALVTAD